MKKLKEIGIGSFRPDTSVNGKHTRSIDLMGPSSNADSVISQRMQYNVGNYNYDEDISYKELGDPDENNHEDDTILECRVYRRGKYCLIETLDSLNEFPDYAGNFEHMMKKISTSAKERQEKIDEDSLDEFSGAAAGGGGPAVPLGYTAKGKPETPSQRKKRQNFNIKKSFPYTKQAKPSKSRKNEISRKKLKSLINEAIRQTVNYQNENIGITSDGNVTIKGKQYKLSVEKMFGFVDIQLSNIQKDSDGNLMITGGALGITETSPLKPDSVNKITAAIKQGKNTFIIAPPRGEEGNTIKFKLVK